MEKVTGWEMASGEGEQLSGEQSRQLRGLVERFSAVFRNEPGCKRVMEHQIPTGPSKPVRLLPYRVSHAHRHALKPVLEEMLERGIIEPSTVEWGFLIVVVGKDGTMRLCVDFRRLNELTTTDAHPITDAYPMPRVNDIIGRAGGANFSLIKEYWQVPVAVVD